MGHYLPGPTATRNSLLTRLPEDVAQRLAPDLTTVPVKVKQIFHRQGEPIAYVYFPNDGVSSITTVLSTGELVESAAVGDEGMLGIEAIPSSRGLWTCELQRGLFGWQVLF